jgi:hypothetical protein
MHSLAALLNPPSETPNSINTWKFISVLTRARHWFLVWNTWTESKSFPTFFSDLILLSAPKASSWFPYFRFCLGFVSTSTTSQWHAAAIPGIKLSHLVMSRVNRELVGGIRERQKHANQDELHQGEGICWSDDVVPRFRWFSWYVWSQEPTRYDPAPEHEELHSPYTQHQFLRLGEYLVCTSMLITKWYFQCQHLTVERLVNDNLWGLGRQLPWPNWSKIPAFAGKDWEKLSKCFHNMLHNKYQGNLWSFVNYT